MDPNDLHSNLDSHHAIEMGKFSPTSDKHDDVPAIVADDKMLEGYWESGKPVPPEAQTWGVLSVVNSWLAIYLNPAALTFGGALMAMGVNWWQFLIAWAVATFVLTSVIILNGMAGPKYGINFPYFSRSVFGVHGAQVAALSRAWIGIGWFSIGSWVGSETVYYAWSHPSIFPSWRNSPKIVQNLNVAEFVLFVVFIGLQAGLFMLGLVRVKMFTHVCTAFAGIFMAGILVWSLVSVSLSDIFSATHVLADAGRAAHPNVSSVVVFLMVLNAAVSGTSSITLNVVDVCHFVHTQRQMIVGHVIGYPVGYFMLLATSVVFVGASKTLYSDGDAWGVAVLFRHLPPKVTTWVSLIFLLAIANNNALGNIHPAANDIMHLRPKTFSYKMSATAALLLAIPFCPWYLLATPDSFVNTFINGYALLSGSIVGVMLVDYHVINKRYLDLKGLYAEPPQTSPYYFTYGYRWEAFAAIAVGAVPLVPGFIRSMSGTPTFTLWDYVYSVSWFWAFFVGGFSYYILVRLTGRRVVAGRNKQQYKRGGRRLDEEKDEDDVEKPKNQNNHPARSDENNFEIENSDTQSE